MKKMIISIAILAASIASYAQSLKVSTGESSGTYSRMFKEVSSVCMSQIPLAEVNSTGSVQNIDRLIGNEVNSAFTQTDVLFYRSRTEDLSNIKTLVALHPEAVHIIALDQTGKTEGGTLGFGSKAVQLDTLNHLAGKTVVAAGGSFITAQVIRLQTEINFQIREVATSAEALKEVSKGQAHAAILVGGAPLPIVSALDRKFKLLSINEASIAKLKNVYNPARISYQNMNMAGIATVSTDAIFITREYKTAKFVEGLSKLRQCFLAAAPELAETTGQHPSWLKVEPSNRGKWAYYDLPVVKK